MKRIIFFLLLFSQVSIFAQIETDSLKFKLIGSWIIKEITIDGVKKPDFDPAFQDEIILRENGIQTTTDKEYEYDQSGPWKVVENKYIELKDAETNETQILEIISISSTELIVKVDGSEPDIKMILIKK